MHQALGHPPPLALGPSPYAGDRWQRPIPELKSGLPNDLGPGGRRHTSADLGSWPGITHRLPDYDPTRCPRWGLKRGITCKPGRLIINALLLFGTAGRWGRRSVVLALRLLRLGHKTSAGQESVNCHFSLVYHHCVLTDLGCFWLDWLG